MNKRLAIVAMLALSPGCTSKETSHIHCGMPNNVAAIQQAINAYRDCPTCGLRLVESTLPGCKEDRALNIVGFYTSHRAGDDDKALIFYQNVHDLADIPAEMHSDAAFIYRKRKAHEESLKSFELAAAKHPDVVLDYEAAEELIALGKYTQAIKKLLPIVAKNKPIRETSNTQMIGEDAIWDDASIALAKSYTASGEYRLAEQVYQDILSIYPADTAAKEGIVSLQVLRDKPYP